MIKPSVETLIAAMQNNQHVVYNKGDYNLNLVGIRKDNYVSNRFDDTMVLFYKQHGEWVIHYYPCTTDPGSYWMFHGLTKGTAILVPDQYRGAYMLGMHKGLYEALVQVEPVSVYRDANSNMVYDGESIETGLFGINVHRANERTTSILVDKWSAGCQVLADPDDFRELISIVKKSIAMGVYGQRITYTLLTEAML